MQTSLYHVQLNVGDAARSLPFYRALFDAAHDSPREYPEYRPGYYAVFFEDPDRLKLEVAHVPTITDGRPPAPSSARS